MKFGIQITAAWIVKSFINGKHASTGLSFMAMVLELNVCRIRITHLKVDFFFPQYFQSRIIHL